MGQAGFPQLLWAIGQPGAGSPISKEIIRGRGAWTSAFNKLRGQQGLA